MLISLLEDKVFDAAYHSVIRQNKTYLNHLIKT